MSTLTRTRRLIFFVLVGALLLVIAAVVVSTMVSRLSAPDAEPSAATRSTDDDDVSSAPLTAFATPSPAPLTDDETAEVQRADAAIDSLLAALDEVSQRGDGSAVGIESIATGWVLGEVQSRAREQYDLGYQQTGEATVTQSTPTEVDLAANPPTITIKVCVDVSEIDVIDTSGKSLKAALYNPGRPTAHIYGAVFDDGTWKVSTHDIPDVQDCPKP